MTTRVDTASASASSGTITLSAMGITGSVRKAQAAVGAGATFTMDAATLGGVALVEDTNSPINAANSYLRVFRLDEASFPGGSTADLVLNTSLGDSDPAGAAGIYGNVTAGAADDFDTDTNNNNDDYVLAATPITADGLAISVCARQVQGGDAHVATGDLATQETLAPGFQHGIAFNDELDPAASSRDGSGDWGANFRDLAAMMLVYTGDAGAGGPAAAVFGHHHFHNTLQ